MILFSNLIHFASSICHVPASTAARTVLRVSAVALIPTAPERLPPAAEGFFDRDLSTSPEAGVGLVLGVAVEGRENGRRDEDLNEGFGVASFDWTVLRTMGASKQEFGCGCADGGADRRGLSSPEGFDTGDRNGAKGGERSGDDGDWMESESKEKRVGVGGSVGKVEEPVDRFNADCDGESSGVGRG